MPFDASSAVEVVPPAFDASTAQPVGPAFDATSATPVDAKEALNLFAKQALSPKATEADRQNYRDAYADYYQENPMGKRVANAIADVHPSEWAGDLWNMAKGVGSSIASNIEGRSATNPGQAAALGATGQGIAAGFKHAVASGANALGGLAEQIGVEGAGIDKAQLNKMADFSLNRMKLAQQIAGDTGAAHYQDPALAANFDTGAAAGQFATMAGTPQPNFAGAIQKGGDFIESGLYKAMGKTAQAAPVVGRAVEGAAAAGGVASAAASGGPVAGALAAGTAAKAYQAGSAVSSGLFSGVGKLGEQVAATPLGQSAIDSIANNAQSILRDARLGVQDAAAEGSAKAIKSAQVRLAVIQKGTDMAQWLQAKGMAGIPSKMADALSGAIQGGITSGTIQALTDPAAANPSGVNTGAAYGSILGMLGTAGLDAERKAATKGLPTEAQIPTPTAEFPGLGEPLQAVGPVDQNPTVATTSYDNVIRNSELRKAASRAGTGTSFMLNGVPHDVDQFTGTLQNASKGVVNAARQENPLETFNFKGDWVKNARTENASALRPSDQDLQAVAAMAKPAGSGTLGMMGYDPNRRLAAVQFFEKGKGGAQTYAIPEMDPQGWSDWNNASSLGAHFNYQIRKAYPILRLEQNLWPELPQGPREAYRPSNVAPSQDLINQNKGTP